MAGRRGASDPGRRSRRCFLPRGLDWLPVILLLSIALNQIWLSHTEGLPSWQGGGFGMFASTESWKSRHIHVWVLEGGTPREIDLSKLPGAKRLNVELQRVLALPTHERLHHFALRIAGLVEGPVDGIAIAVYGVSHDPTTLAPTGKLVRGIEVKLAR
jgi:hypothetical protein